MNEGSFIAETPSAKIVVDIKYTMTSSNSLLAYENKCEIDKLCELRCQNYNNKWSCPPFSPKYSSISKRFSNIYILLFYCSLEQFNYIKMPYMKIRVANSILRSKSNKIIKQLEKESDGRMLASGSCHLCKVCSCKDKEVKCKKPLQLRYSMEAVGLNIEKIARDFFNHELSRYSKKDNLQYASVITAILTNNIMDNNEIKNIYSNQ